MGVFFKYLPAIEVGLLIAKLNEDIKTIRKKQEQYEQLPTKSSLEIIQRYEDVIIYISRLIQDLEEAREEALANDEQYVLSIRLKE